MDWLICFAPLLMMGPFGIASAIDTGAEKIAEAIRSSRRR